MTGYHPELVGQTFDTEKAKNLLKQAGFKEEVKDEETEEETSDEESAEETEEESTDDTEETTEEEPKPEMPEGVVMKLTMTIMESEEFNQVAERLKQDLLAAGIDLEIIRVPSELFFTEVIEPRNFELLLTAVMMNADGDPYPFWHSSEVEKGLNLAGFASSNADKLLEKGRTQSEEEKDATYRQFQEIVVKEVPAVFLYQSIYTYALPKKIQGVDLTDISSPSDRFADVTSWYIKTKKALQ